MEEFKLIAKTFQGLEEVLAKELTGLGAKDIAPGRRMVSFTGDKELMYRANFSLRTAIRVLKPIANFKANTADEVYEAVKSIDWNNYLDLNTSFAVDSVVYSEDFKHSKFVAYKVKDAIVDYFREQTGKRPNISVTNPDIKFNMHIAEDNCTLSLDSSGESLHKRGYREATVDSPINEVLAAGMILLTGWHGECDLIDPMCGSGTIAIEAALIARNMAPGIFRKKYAFENWKDFDRELFDHIYNDDSQEKTFEHHIYAYDLDKNAVAVAQRNANAAGVANDITIVAQPIQQFKQPAEKSIMITNPPYGERISSPNLLGLYRTLGDRLKHQFVGNEAWIIGYREETFEQIGLKPSLKIPLFNGSLDCEFRKYQIFDGKLENFRAQGNILKTEEDKERNAAKRKLKPHHDFKQAANYDEEDLESEIPEYIRIRHREFVQNQLRDTRRNRYDDYDKKDDDDKRRNRRGDSRKEYGNYRNEKETDSFKNRDNYSSPRQGQNPYNKDKRNERGSNSFRDRRPYDKDKKAYGNKDKGRRPNRRFNGRNDD